MKKYCNIFIICSIVLFLCNTEVFAGYIERLQLGGENEGTSIEYFDDDYDKDRDDNSRKNTGEDYDIKYQYVVPIYTTPYYRVNYFPPATYRPYYPPMPPHGGMYPPPKPMGNPGGFMPPPPQKNPPVKPPSNALPPPHGINPATGIRL